MKYITGMTARGIDVTPSFNGQIIDQIILRRIEIIQKMTIAFSNRKNVDFVK